MGPSARPLEAERPPERLKPERCQGHRRPSCRLGLGRFGYDEQTARTKERCSALGCHRRRSEPTGHDKVVGEPHLEAATSELCPFVADLKSVRPLEVLHVRRKESGSLSPPVEERSARLWGEGGNHESGEAAT